MFDFRQLLGANNEYYSEIRNLDPENKCPNLLFHQEKLQVGRRSSRSHYHSKKQECIFIISGELSVIEGQEKHCLKAGESYSFPPSKTAHYLKNEGIKEAVYLSVATDFKGDQTKFLD